MKVRLITESFRRKVNGELYFYRQGDVVEVPGEVGSRLLKLKSAVDVDEQDGPDPEAKPETTAEPEAKPGTTAETETETGNDGDGPQRPKNAENKDAWIAYYRAVKGTDPDAKMSKDDIMAAVG